MRTNHGSAKSKKATENRHDTRPQQQTLGTVMNIRQSGRPLPIVPRRRIPGPMLCLSAQSERQRSRYVNSSKGACNCVSSTQSRRPSIISDSPKPAPNCSLSMQPATPHHPLAGRSPVLQIQISTMMHLPPLSNLPATARRERFC
jgi:hypothetical protein